MAEHIIQNQIRNALVGHGMFFRANVGSAWAGKATRMGGGAVVIENARPFSTGLPPGFSDLFGFVPVEITPEMVGQTIATVVAMEVKTATGRVSDKQANFLEAVRKIGGRAGVVRSPADALALIGK